MEKQIIEQQLRTVEQMGCGMCSGTTAVAALLRSGRMSVAWVGDCRAVLCRDGDAVSCL